MQAFSDIHPPPPSFYFFSSFLLLHFASHSSPPGHGSLSPTHTPSPLPMAGRHSHQHSWPSPAVEPNSCNSPLLSLHLQFRYLSVLRVRPKILSSYFVHLLIQNGRKCYILMWKLLFCSLIEVLILNLKFELCLEVCEIVVKFWGIVGKLEVEETRGGRTQM